MAGFSFLSAALLVVMLAPLPAWAQVGADDRAEILRLARLRGATEADVAPLIREVNGAVDRGLPQPPLVNKVKEGLSKGHPPARVQAVLTDLVRHMEAARELLGAVPDEGARARATVVLGEALFRGVTRDEFLELRRYVEQGAARPDAERLALGARTWSILKEAGFSASDALPLVADAVRLGFRDSDMMALAREATARREDRAATPVDALRDAVRRGQPERPPRDAHDVPERPRAERPRAPERPAERPPAPERPPARERVDRPERPR